MISILAKSKTSKWNSRPSIVIVARVLRAFFKPRAHGRNKVEVNVTSSCNFHETGTVRSERSESGSLDDARQNEISLQARYEPNVLRRRC